MKKWTVFFTGLVLIALGLVIPKSYAGDKLLNANFPSAEIYYAINNISMQGSLYFYVTVLTPEEVAYGQYNSGARRGDTLQVISWTGLGPAPKLVLTDFGNTATSNCPGIDTSIYKCGFMTFSITVSSDDYGCPWIASFYSVSQANGFSAYKSPIEHNTVCPTIPVSPYDISWSDSYVSHTKTLQLQSNGSTITTTLSTYLMESGNLCDGSNFDARGAYCRAVSDLLTFTSYGCDNAKVTVTPTRKPLTDRKLHDIVVKVNTSSRQPIDSTCRFQYVLNEL
ncbi:DUF2544 domain-containing protein [Escherichia coli]|uniref:StfH/YfcO family fimbrial adhesin n=1 Tax=Escherichia sp. MOD1-EC4550 TaxID=2093861 RepID=UPI000CF790D5|nr:StfH/YfcO family fimbrial adhesin [Escherichia sp. MOD1-EC4550]EGO8720878.1 DUF2544 domain-containing protein [Escherichia coli]MCS1346244.1 YfcO family protein [Escherichia coli]HAW4048122.1 DUF2544 domain-containing protein [Escherichia coli]